MSNFNSFQPVSSDLLAETYLDTSCVEDYNQAISSLAQDIDAYVKEANWFEKNRSFNSEYQKHDHRMSIIAARIFNATGRMAHIVCHALL